MNRFRCRKCGSEYGNMPMMCEYPGCGNSNPALWDVIDIPDPVAPQPFPEPVRANPEPVKVNIPKTENVKPEKVKAPKPEKVKSPKPEKVKAPKPEKAKSPKPEKVKSPKPEKIKEKKVKPVTKAAGSPPTPDVPQPEVQKISGRIRPTLFFWLSKAVLIGAIFCFFMPFMVISYKSNRYSGVYTRICGESGMDVLFGIEGVKEERQFNVIFIAAAVLLVIALLLPMASSLFSMASAGSLVYFIILASDTYYISGTELELDYGVYVVTGLLIAASMLAITDFFIRRRKKKKLQSQ